MMSRILTITALAASAVAHFTLDYPLTRGFNEVRAIDSFQIVWR